MCFLCHFPLESPLIMNASLQCLNYRSLWYFGTEIKDARPTSFYL